MMSDQLKVMISSTVRDLPEHRKEVMEACLRQGMFPIMMEHLPASDEDAIPTSMGMVDDADVYLLILAYRYGDVPKANNPNLLSVTEHEYNRAAERKIPILTFLMHDDHPIKAVDVEKAEGAVKLESFKSRALVKVTSFFKSPASLRADVIDSLSRYRRRDLTAFNYLSDIPAPPEVYIAHPYMLLQTQTLIGRQKELKLLTDWITGKPVKVDGHKAPAGSIRVMTVVAIGGMGKSALTWKWFNRVAPREVQNLAGRLWWSFYEREATFENFVTRALCYVTKRPLDEVQRVRPPDRQDQLLTALDREPFLFVLDGLERTLVAHTRMGKSHLDDSEVEEEENLNKVVDPNVGSFLKKLAHVKHSLILVSSQFFPTELKTTGGDPIPGSFKLLIEGLTKKDSLEFWRAFGLSGARNDLLRIFDAVDRHPLMIQALAGEVKCYRKAPGNFQEWRKRNPQIETTKFAKLSDTRNHVLEIALLGLNESASRVLEVVSAFMVPVTYDTLTAVLVTNTEASGASANQVVPEERRIFKEEMNLDSTLTELEDRGLLGWDKRSNSYNVHSIVRAVVWDSLSGDTQRDVYADLKPHFERLALIDVQAKSAFLDDLTPAIELYEALIRLGRYDDAGNLFYDRLDKVLRQFGHSRLQIDLLEQLFSDGRESLPRLTNPEKQVATMNALALAYQLHGRPGEAIKLLRRGLAVCRAINNQTATCRGMGSLSNALLPAGAIFQSEFEARRSLIIARTMVDAVTQNDFNAEVITGMPLMTYDSLKRYLEGVGLTRLGMAFAARGIRKESGMCLNRALLLDSTRDKQAEAVDNYYLAERALWFGNYEAAAKFADLACQLGSDLDNTRDFIRGRRVKGNAALGLNDLVVADEKLHLAFTRAHTFDLVEQKLPARIMQAESRRRQAKLKEGRASLDEIWQLAERGPYPLLHADAFNVLAQIERDEGNVIAAIEAAKKAYQLAWCDGPPFAYYCGLEKAKKHLKELGAPDPEMPPFDQSKFEQMPEVEIDPDDEFHVGEISENEISERD